MRALISRAFTSPVIAALETRIRALSRELLDRHIERGTMDLAEDFAIPQSPPGLRSRHPLSRLEARITIGDLVQRLTEFDFAADTRWEPRKALHVHGPARLPIRFAPGSRSADGP